MTVEEVDPTETSAAPVSVGQRSAARVAEVFTTDGTFNTKSTRVLSLDRGALPASYRSNSRKEELQVRCHGEPSVCAACAACDGSPSSFGLDAALEQRSRCIAALLPS